jgi:hypothetical protein
MRVRGMRVRGMRVREMRIEHQFSVRITWLSPFTWGVHVSSRLHGCRGCILADGLAALELVPTNRGD